MLKLSEGQFDGIPFLLDPSQAFILGSLFGWKTHHRHHGIVRRFRRAYLEQGKGNGKSPLLGGIGLYGLHADGENSAQVYAAGATRDQAKVLFADAVKMVRQSPALAARLEFSGGAGRENNIAHLESASFFRPVSRETKRSGSGPRPHFALIDEVHEHPDGGTIETLERGFKSRTQPLLVMATNSGSDRKSICWDEHQHAIRVAAGTMTPGPDHEYVGETIVDDSTFSYVCALDNDDDALNDPTCWVKANPLLGTILQPEDIQKAVNQAKNMPGKRNGILRLHFCVWTDSDTAWIGRETLNKVLATFDPAEHAGKSVALGIDLSGHRDLTAIAHVVETGTVMRPAPDGVGEIAMPTYDAWIEAWTPGDNIRDRSEKDQAPYADWADESIAEAEGRKVWLRAPPGERIRMDFVAAYLAEVDQTYKISLLAFDRYVWDKLSDEIDALGLNITQASHPQAAQRPSKPPQELIDQAKSSGREPPQGLWMPKSKLRLEELILDQRIRLLANPVLISACMSAAVGIDPMGNEYFHKNKATQRIDPLVSLAMAVGASAMGDVEPVKKGSPYNDRPMRFM
ncbi:MAG: terminase large subunit [Brevundimonas sp.]|uniref:terminase large subunit n=1 Tax=Brevundimonas sp. TaxID=1871086 RepID=UPI003919AAB6